VERLKSGKGSKRSYRLINLSTGYPSFFVAGFVPVTFFSLAGLDLPNDPLKIFPFLVFLSPLPIVVFFCCANVVKIVAHFTGSQRAEKFFAAVALLLTFPGPGVRPLCAFIRLCITVIIKKPRQAGLQCI
jgi:hypothetical protein